ncbi:MAG: hypothetical protein ABI446_02825 [Gemmatimonadaceae bacterium]
MSHAYIIARLALLSIMPMIASTPGLDPATHDMIEALHAGAKPNVVTVVASEFSFEMPLSIPAGLTTFELRNHGKLVHHLTVARLDSGKTAGDAVEAMVRLGHNLRPGYMRATGGPNAVMPGAATNATVELAPGRYIAYCEVPGPTPARHYMMGMVKQFEVTPSSKSGAFSVADIKMGLSDYTFVLSRPLTRGHHVIAVTNGSTQPHMVAIKRYPIGYPAGTAANQLAAWAKNPLGRPSPGVSVGGITEIGPAGVAVMESDVGPGMYLLICFSAAPDGTPHFRLGMQKEITVR